MLAGGAEGFAFDPLVLIGCNAANPHGSPGDIPLTPGAPLLIDFGASVEGYNADITRTFYVKEVSDYDRAFYETVLAANTKGREMSRAGITASAAVASPDTSGLPVCESTNSTRGPVPRAACTRAPTLRATVCHGWSSPGRARTIAPRRRRRAGTGRP